MKITKEKFLGPHDPKLVNYYNSHPAIESKVYDESLKNIELRKFCLLPEIINPVKELIGNKIGLFEKIIARMDIPFWTKELALWHQDYFYVQGNTNVLTAWIPLQDTNYVNGCLSVMPRSHLLGIVEHDLKIGKKNIPSKIFDNEIRFVEIKKGDLLLFNALLLHSSNVNFSDSIRYSLQPRYTPLNLKVDESMLGVIEINDS